jgi:ABC-type glutathione transport system ATPase component
MALGGGDVGAATTVVAAIRERALDRRAPVVVAIDGRSGAGKSTLAAGIAAYYVSPVSRSVGGVQPDRTGHDDLPRQRHGSSFALAQVWSGSCRGRSSRM